MQDANEFLTRILDTVKDEIDRCHMTTPSPDRHGVSKDEDCGEIFPNTRFPKLKSAVEDNFENEINFDTKRSPCSQNVSDITQQDCDAEDSPVCERVLTVGENEDQDLPLCPQLSNTPNKGCDEEALPRNPVKDNFEFQLFESYRCLG